MTQEQILQYLDLTNRRLYILTHSGIDWKPEYAAELEEIDQKLADLRPLVDAEHAKRFSDAPAEKFTPETPGLLALTNPLLREVVLMINQFNISTVGDLFTFVGWQHHDVYDWVYEHFSLCRELCEMPKPIKYFIPAELPDDPEDSDDVPDPTDEEDRRAEIRWLLEDVDDCRERLDVLKKYLAENICKMSLDEIREHVRAEIRFEQILERDDDRLGQLGSCAGDDPALYTEEL